MFGCSASPNDRFIPQGTHLLTISLLTYLGDLPVPGWAASFGPVRWREGLPNRNIKARGQRPTALPPKSDR